MKKFLLLCSILALSINAKAQNWTLLDSINGSNIYSINFLNGQRGWLTGGYILARTTNSGDLFFTATNPFQYVWYNGCHFFNETTGFAWGGSHFGLNRDVIVKTTDGGITWDSVRGDLGGGSSIQEMVFIDTNTAWLYTDFGQLYKTNDGGKTIIQANTPSNFSVQQLELFSPDYFLMSGRQYQSSGITEYRIYMTTDGGQNWQNTYADISIFPMSVTFTDNNNGYAACNDGYLLKTIDGGQTWAKVKVAPDSIDFNKIKFFGTSSGALLGTNPFTSGGSYVFLTKDNGQTWQQSLFDPYEYFTDVSFPTVDTGFVVGWQKIYRTFNGGGVTEVKNLENNSGGVVVYPNPANDKVYLECSAGTKIQKAELYNMAGQKVHETGKGVREINISSLPAGTYSLLLTTNKGTISNLITVR